MSDEEHRHGRPTDDRGDNHHLARCCRKREQDALFALLDVHGRQAHCALLVGAKLRRRGVGEGGAGGKEGERAHGMENGSGSEQENSVSSCLPHLGHRFAGSGRNCGGKTSSSLGFGAGNIGSCFARFGSIISQVFERIFSSVLRRVRRRPFQKYLMVSSSRLKIFARRRAVSTPKPRQTGHWRGGQGPGRTPRLHWSHSVSAWTPGSLSLMEESTLGRTRTRHTVVPEYWWRFRRIEQKDFCPSARTRPTIRT